MVIFYSYVNVFQRVLLATASSPSSCRMMVKSCAASHQSRASCSGRRMIILHYYHYYHYYADYHYCHYYYCYYYYYADYHYCHYYLLLVVVVAVSLLWWWWWWCRGERTDLTNAQLIIAICHFVHGGNQWFQGAITQRFFPETPTEMYRVLSIEFK